MKKLLPGILLAFIIILGACKTVPTDSDTSDTSYIPANQNTTRVNGQVKTDSDGDIVAQFDTITITKQKFETTKSEIQLVVEDLNKITFSRDYDRWLTYLSDEYFQTYSDPANLEMASALLPAQSKGIKLRTLRDYFNYIFVPSRQNIRVDDIQFVSPTRVYVIMELAPNSPAAIYILENTQKGWKLVIKNR